MFSGRAWIPSFARDMVLLLKSTQTCAIFSLDGTRSCEAHPNWQQTGGWQSRTDLKHLLGSFQGVKLSFGLTPCAFDDAYRLVALTVSGWRGTGTIVTWSYPIDFAHTRYTPANQGENFLLASKNVFRVYRTFDLIVKDVMITKQILWGSFNCYSEKDLKGDYLLLLTITNFGFE